MPEDRMVQTILRDVAEQFAHGTWCFYDRESGEEAALSGVVDGGPGSLVLVLSGGEEDENGETQKKRYRLSVVAE